MKERYLHKDLKLALLNERLTELEGRVKQLEKTFGPQKLNPLEKQVLQCIVNGMTYKETAIALHKSPRKILYLRSRIHLKLNTGGNNGKLVNIAVTELGITPKFHASHTTLRNLLAQENKK